MSMTTVSQFEFNNQYGITGNLACDPVFAQTKNGDAYAKLTIFCKAQVPEGDIADGGKGHSKPTQDGRFPLVAYIAVFDETLLDDVQTLGIGDFVNFTYDKVTIVLGEDEETSELGVKASFVATALEVRHKARGQRRKQTGASKKVTTQDKKPRRSKAIVYQKRSRG